MAGDFEYAEDVFGHFLSLGFFDSSAESHDARLIPFYKRAFLVRGWLSALTGGFFFDYRVNVITNTVHFYIWLVLLYLPFALLAVCADFATGLGVYLAVIFVFLTIIKVSNHLLHGHLNKDAESAALEMGTVSPPSQPAKVSHEQVASVASPVSLEEPSENPGDYIPPVVDMPPSLYNHELLIPTDIMDTRPGTVHFFHDADGMMSFYVFSPDGIDDTIDTDDIAVRRYLEYFIDMKGNVPAPRRVLYQPKRTRDEDEDEEGVQWPIGAPALTWWLILLIGPRVSRRSLEALFDRTHHWWQVLLGISFSLLAGGIGFTLLPFCRLSITKLFCCFTIAGAQFSFLKSAQPDAASPQHVSATAVYSRAFYLCFFGALSLIFDTLAQHVAPNTSTTFFGFILPWDVIFPVMREVFFYAVVILPCLVVLCLLPQVSTLANYFIEQTLLHAFGTTATQSLRAATMNLFIAVVSFVVNSFVCYAALSSPNRSVAFAAFCGFIVFSAYLLAATEKMLVTDIGPRLRLALHCMIGSSAGANNEEINPPLLTAWLVQDVIIAAIMAVVIFVVHLSGIFGNPITMYFFASLSVAVGLILHFIYPELRKPYPFRFLAFPVLKSAEFSSFNIIGPSRRMWFETAALWLRSIETYVLLPPLFVCTATISIPFLTQKYSLMGAAFLLAGAFHKLVRGGFTDTSLAYLTPLFALLLFRVDYVKDSESPVLDFFFVSMAVIKLTEAIHKMNFLLVYVVPFNVGPASVVHAILLPFAIPHTVICFAQLLLSSALSVPFVPFIGSSVFVMSYPRPVRFWERTYRTTRLDNSNYRPNNLSFAQSARGETAASTLNNLNAVFYDHVTQSLRKSLYDDIVLGRWPNVSTGDVFLLTSDKMTAVVHIIQVGNGFVTFQLRGLEFAGTYCQQRELEAINENDYENDTGVLCFKKAHMMPSLLSFNAVIKSRWTAWELVNPSLSLKTYSIGLVAAQALFNSYTMQDSLIEFLYKTIIFEILRSESLSSWLSPDTEIGRAAEAAPRAPPPPMRRYMSSRSGADMKTFLRYYESWIEFCFQKRQSSESHVNLGDTIATEEENDKAEEETKDDANTSEDIAATADVRASEDITASDDDDTAQFVDISGDDIIALEDALAITYGPDVPPTVDIDITSTDSVPDSTSSAPGPFAPRPSRRSIAARLPAALVSAASSDRQNGSTGPFSPATYPSTVPPRIINLCFAAAMVTRRMLFQAVSVSDSFVAALYLLFKEDLALAEGDEWAQGELASIITNASRAALKLHLDVVAHAEDLSDHEILASTISNVNEEVLVCHEHDPQWTAGIHADRSTLLSLRRTSENANRSPEFFVLTLTLRHQKFRLLKLNREGVRSLWAAQQQELIFFGNENAERGSIQQMRSAIRNIITQACDLPVGYPIFISGLTTAYANAPPSPTPLWESAIGWMRRLIPTKATSA